MDERRKKCGGDIKLSVKRPTKAELALEQLHISVSLMEMEPNVVNIVKDYKKHFEKVVLATDNMDVFSQFNLPDNLFDDVLSSSEVRALKRTPENFFGKYLLKHNILPKQCLLLDDSEVNCLEFKDWGGKSIVFKDDVSTRISLEKLLHLNSNKS